MFTIPLADVQRGENFACDGWEKVQVVDQLSNNVENVPFYQRRHAR